MKVSEAVERLRYAVRLNDVGQVNLDEIDLLLASHEALRLAGEAVVQTPATVPPDLRALSLAVEDAGR